MSPLTKIIFSAIISGFLSALIFTVFFVLGAFLFLRNIEIAFLVSAKPVTPIDNILILLCVLGIIISIVICPYIAYQMRETIFDTSELAALRILLFSIVALSQVIFLVLGYFLVLPPVVRTFKKEDKIPVNQTLRKQTNENIIKKLNKANVEVICKKAKVISDSGLNVTAEFTLQIKNVPKDVPYYLFQIHSVNEGNSFRVGRRTIYSNGGFAAGVNPLNIEAVNENGEWIFYKGDPQKVIVGTADEFSFQLEFYRENLPNSSLPETVTPELKIFPRNKSDYFNQYVFFNKPIPVNFKFTY